jgi:uncharacterized protein
MKARQFNSCRLVLLTLDDSNFPLGVKNTLNGGDIPVAWINSKYRMVYLNYGHGDRIYSTPVLPTMIDNSVRFLLAPPKSLGPSPSER